MNQELAIQFLRTVKTFRLKAIILYQVFLHCTDTSVLSLLGQTAYRNGIGTRKRKAHDQRRVSQKNDRDIVQWVETLQRSTKHTKFSMTLKKRFRNTHGGRKVSETEKKTHEQCMSLMTACRFSSRFSQPRRLLGTGFTAQPAQFATRALSHWLFLRWM